MGRDPDNRSGPEKRREAFLAELKARRERHERNKEDRSFWSSVGTTGTVGWSVSLPTAIGVLFGRWLDAKLDSEYVFMIFFMFIGLIFGCLMAWRLVSERL